MSLEGISLLKGPTLVPAGSQDLGSDTKTGGVRHKYFGEIK